jgi:hypothetical protein
MSELSDAVFGTSGDSVNLSERFASCSYGQLIMKPYEDTTTTGVSIPGTQYKIGLVEVEISNNVQGATDDTIKNAAETAARALLGDLPDQFDHVIFCIPPGTNGNWIAYGKFARRVLLLRHLRAHECLLFSPLSAGVNSWYSVYNDAWCTYPSVLLHEIGKFKGVFFFFKIAIPSDNSLTLVCPSQPRFFSPRSQSQSRTRW